MKKTKLAFFLLLALFLFVPAAMASSLPTVEDAAAELTEQELLRGAWSGRTGQASMALDRQATRAEAVTLFVRLLGQEDAALSHGYTHPFSDVRRWASPYVGYAYESGLTNGRGRNTFGYAKPITLDTYVTFFLRALGYDEDAGDFAWKTAADFGLELGLYDEEFLLAHRSTLSRGELIQVSAAMLHYLADHPLAEPPIVSEVPPEPRPAGSEELDAVQAYLLQVVELVNAERGKRGVAPLLMDDDLSACAAIRADEIQILFGHTRPDGTRCFTVLDENDIPYNTAGENIASGQRTPQRVVSAWMASEAHRKNILNPVYTRIGVAYLDQCWVQLFTAHPDDVSAAEHEG